MCSRLGEWGGVAAGTEGRVFCARLDADVSWFPVNTPAHKTKQTLTRPLSPNHPPKKNVRTKVIQGGDPTGTGKGGRSIYPTPNGKFADEIVDSLRHSKRGVVSMANSGPNTNGASRLALPPSSLLFSALLSSPQLFSPLLSLLHTPKHHTTTTTTTTTSTKHNTSTTINHHHHHHQSTSIIINKHKQT